MDVQWGYNWNTVYSKTHDVYSSTFPYQVVNDVRSTFRASIPDTITSTPYITWNIGIQGDPCPGSHGFDQATGVEDPTKAGQAALQACVADIAHSRPGLYWMIWNEPDLGGTDSDGVTPALAAQYFKTISDTILSADPTARLIVGNVGSIYPLHPMSDCVSGSACGVYWLTQFIESYTMTNGIDPRAAITGYGMHAYSDADISGLGLTTCGTKDVQLLTTTNGCLLQHFTSTVLTAVNWVSTTDAGKEVWVTEANWQSGDNPGDTWITQTFRMQQICAQLPLLGIDRYAWWNGGYPYTSTKPGLITPSLYLADISTNPVIYTGTLSPAGTAFINNCTN